MACNQELKECSNPFASTNGHKPGHEWKYNKTKYEREGLKREEVIELENNPDIYRMESKEFNQSHAGEMPVNPNIPQSAPSVPVNPN